MSSSRFLRAFKNDERATVAMIFGAALLPVTMMLGASYDFGRAMDARSELQGAADAAALAAAILENVTDAERKTKAETTFRAKLTNSSEVDDINPAVSIADNEITVSVTASIDTSFLSIMNIGELSIETYSRAQTGHVVEEEDDEESLGKICALALDPSSTDSIHIQGNNDLSHSNCWGYTNATASTAINANGSQATALGKGYCAVGGYVGEHNNFSPEPATGCSTVSDPFATTGAYSADAYDATFDAPEISSTCIASNLNLKRGTYTLQPGRYCGGINLQAHAKVTMAPGVYIIDNGHFNVQSGASLSGSNVLIYYSGANARMTIIGGGTISLTGRSDGESYEGFLMIAHPDAWRGGESNIQGGGTFNMEGVVYMPTQRIEVSGNGDVNASSKYFGMIAKDFYLRGNGVFHLKGHDGTSALPDILPEMPKELSKDVRLIR